MITVGPVVFAAATRSASVATVFILKVSFLPPLVPPLRVAYPMSQTSKMDVLLLSVPSPVSDNGEAQATPTKRAVRVIRSNNFIVSREALELNMRVIVKMLEER
jgi:hypothetical protein